jgi:outer membrane protein TolC
MAAACAALVVLTAAADLRAQTPGSAKPATPAAPLVPPMSIVTNPDSAIARALATIRGTPISLADAVQASLKGSTDVMTATADLRAAKGSARRERGAFDPELFANWNRVDQELPRSSFFSGTKLRETTATGGARVKLPFGTQLSASLDALRTENNSPFTLLDPQYDAAGRLSLRQPLLRGFGPGTSGERSAAERDLEAAQARYDDAISLVEADVEQTYWEVYAMERDLAVAHVIRDQSEALLNQARLRNRAGLVGPVQVATATAFLAEREQALLDTQELLDLASDRLASLIGIRPVGTPARFHPTDEPPRDYPIDPEEDLIQRALQNNPEVRAREHDVAAARARHQGARWNAYPSLDVFGTLGGLGLAGTDSAGVGGDMGEAVSQATHREFATWSAGAAVSIPIGLREGRGERDRLQAEAERAQAQLVAGQRTLADEVRSGHRELLNATARLDAARRGVDAGIEQVRIGVLEYNNGRSTAFEVTRLAGDLAEASRRYSQALVRTARAAARLRYLTSGGAPPASNRGDSSE